MPHWWQRFNPFQPSVGVKTIYPVLLFSEFFRIIKTLDTYQIKRLRLTGVDVVYLQTNLKYSYQGLYSLKKLAVLRV